MMYASERCRGLSGLFSLSLERDCCTLRAGAAAANESRKAMHRCAWEAPTRLSRALSRLALQSSPSRGPPIHRGGGGPASPRVVTVRPYAARAGGRSCARRRRARTRDYHRTVQRKVSVPSCACTMSSAVHQPLKRQRSGDSTDDWRPPIFSPEELAAQEAEEAAKEAERVAQLTAAWERVRAGEPSLEDTSFLLLSKVGYRKDAGERRLSEEEAALLCKPLSSAAVTSLASWMSLPNEDPADQGYPRCLTSTKLPPELSAAVEYLSALEACMGSDTFSTTGLRIRSAPPLSVTTSPPLQACFAQKVCSTSRRGSSSSG